MNHIESKHGRKMSRNIVFHKRKILYDIIERPKQNKSQVHMTWKQGTDYKNDDYTKTPILLARH